MTEAFHLTEPATSAEFDEYYELRWRELRAPWQQPRGSERDELEDASRHIAARSSAGEVIGVGRLHFIDAATAQIRYMATAATHCRLGVGSAIIRQLEIIAAEAGRTGVLINARLHAVPFYEKNGYTVVGDGHLLYGTIAHKRMKKVLAPG